MNAEGQLYKAANKYLLALSERKNWEILDNEIPSNKEREAIHGILEKEGAAQYFNGLGFLITQYGHAIIRKGGLYKQYNERKRKNRWTYIGIGCGIIAAIASVTTLIISLLS